MYDYFMESKIFQMFIFGLGEYLETSLKKGLGGVIFFADDIKSESQFKSMIELLKSKSSYNPFMSIDQEGGRVERTLNIYPRRLSPRDIYKLGEEKLVAQTNQMAKELKYFGINLNFAPCADVNTNPNNPIIGERAFSNNTEDVIKGVKIVSNVYKQNNIIPCIKHYPGHGDADRDSHLTLPVIDLPLKEMENIHIKPFKEAIKSGADMIMAAHLHCTCFDKEAIPSSLSKNAISYLRNNLNFSGVIISDDMVMEGVKQYGSAKAVITGIKAGLDMFIYRDANNYAYETVTKIIDASKNDKILASRIEESFNRIMRLKEKYKI